MSHTIESLKLSLSSILSKSVRTTRSTRSFRSTRSTSIKLTKYPFKYIVSCEQNAGYIKNSIFDCISHYSTFVRHNWNNFADGCTANDLSKQAGRTNMYFDYDNVEHVEQIINLLMLCDMCIYIFDRHVFAVNKYVSYETTGSLLDDELNSSITNEWIGTPKCILNETGKYKFSVIEYTKSSYYLLVSKTSTTQQLSLDRKWIHIYQRKSSRFHEVDA